jgi:hypothetical protein
MTQAMESLVREEPRISRGDFDGYLGMCTADFVFNVRGETLWGVYKGRDRLHELARRAMESEHTTFSSGER